MAAGKSPVNHFEWKESQQASSIIKNSSLSIFCELYLDNGMESSILEMELYFYLTVNDKQSEGGRSEDGRFAGIVSLIRLSGIPDDEVTLSHIAGLRYHGDSSPAER